MARPLLARVKRSPAARVAAGAAAIALPVAGFAVAVAGAGSGEYAIQAGNHDLWATINVCKPQHHPRPKMGVRARMPADNPQQQLHMRFVAQYRHDHKWHRLKHGGDSGWQSLGSGFVSQESGWNFYFDQPAAGQSFLMRGLVKFRWKENGSIVRRATRTTTSGHKASPKAYSAATCKISGPPARQTVPQQSTTSAR